jgi:hypothetical protein
MKQGATAGAVLAAALSPMFQVTVVDHLRLSFASVLAAYEAHAEAAARLARVHSYAKLVLLGLSGITAATAAIASGGGEGWARATAVLAALVFGVIAAYVAMNNQPLMYGHRMTAAKLWVVCEKYRALLAELHDGVIDTAAARQRRNDLLNDAATVLEQASPDDRHTYEIARKALSGPNGAGYPDWLIDRYLPAALRKGPVTPPRPEASVPPAA